MRNFLQNIRTFVKAALVTGFYWAWSRTWRFEHVNHPPGPGPWVYGHWHGDELLLIGAYVRRGMAIMASRSRDGELVHRMLRWLGYRVVRGSSSRGGAAGLKGLIDTVRRQGCLSSLAVDGPRGPIYQVKPGVLKLAQQTGVPLVAGVGACSRRFVFKKAWNQCYLPLPFARCIVMYGEPVTVPPDLSAEELERLRREFEGSLRRLKAQVEARLGGPVDSRLLQWQTTQITDGV